MGNKKRASTSTEEVEEIKAGNEMAECEFNALKYVQESQNNVKPMERRKKRKNLDKERHLHDLNKKAELSKPVEVLAVKEASFSPPALSVGSTPGFHINVFRDLVVSDILVRKAAAGKLVAELLEVQRVFEMMGGEKGEEEEGAVQLEAEKDDGLENCAPSLRYAIRRLIRGVSSSREVKHADFLLFVLTIVLLLLHIFFNCVLKFVVYELVRTK